MEGLSDNERLVAILVVNGATLLIVVILMIRTNARVLERLFNGFTSSMTDLKDEFAGLRADIRQTGQANAVAIGALTERVSRIEGKIEGIASTRPARERAEISDFEGELTPVESRPIRRAPTPPPVRDEDNVYVDPSLGASAPDQTPTPPSGTTKRPTTYGIGPLPAKPPRGGKQ